jgi:hypothetical protein
VYAAVHDWQTGERITLDFSTGAYIDAYDGNLNTLKNMEAEHPNKYHIMMSDIYDKVRCVLYSFDNSSPNSSTYCQLDNGQNCPNCQYPY